MAMVFDVLEEERRRLVQLKERYEREISEFPKGALSSKKRWNKHYCYLAYRASNRVRFDYVGPADSDAVKELEARIKQRNDLEEKLRQVKENLDQVERGLRGKG